MKTMGLVGMVMLGCGGSPGMSVDARTTPDGGPLPPFADYRCTVMADAGDCLATFLAGETSECSYTSGPDGIQVVRPTGSGYELVATCVAPMSAPVVPTVPACTVAGVTYPACDGAAHTYAVKWTEPGGNVIVCVTDANPARPGCAIGDPCVVYPATGGALAGTCL
jgi:hypothetical protein